MTDMTTATPTALPTPTAKPAAPKPTARKAISTKQLAYALAKKHKFTKKHSKEILGDLFGLITKHLTKRARVKIAGLGILQVRNRAARMGRNPATGEAIKIPAKTVVKARIAKQLKDAVLPKK